MIQIAPKKTKKLEEVCVKKGLPFGQKFLCAVPTVNPYKYLEAKRRKKLAKLLSPILDDCSGFFIPTFIVHIIAAFAGSGSITFVFVNFFHFEPA